MFLGTDTGGDNRGYIGWHRDRDGPGIGVSCNPGAIIKVFTYMEDVQENGGPTTVVPVRISIEMAAFYYCYYWHCGTHHIVIYRGLIQRGFAGVECADF